MKIHIENLSFNCIIGILDLERIKKQKVIVNLSFKYDYKEDSFVNYAEVALLVEKTMKEKEFMLLEEAILFIEELLYKTYKNQNLNSLLLKITKPNILKNCIVSLEN